jgi:cation-transporting ATPase E
MLSIGLVPMAALLFIANFSAARVNETLIAVSSAVLGMIPIGMFLLTSTAFAVSVLKLARRKTLLKDLYGIEMLAASDTLLFDKTGTITDGNLEVVGVKVFADIIGESQTDAFSGLCISDVLTTLLTTGAGANATAAAVGERFKGKTLRTTDAVMFDSDKKYSAAEIDGQYTYVLGAPDFLTDDADVLEFCGESSQKCRRTILLARAKNGIENISPEFLTPVMAMALEDSLRGEISETFAWLEKNNVNIKIVSGDDPATVCEIAKKAGLSGTDKYVNCARMDDGALKEAIDGNLVFGRASPEQKAVIVKELRRRGRVVCMVGDGVNDIQALKQADCSVSFACASDVARNISRIVLMDSEFKSIPSIIEEGRRVIGNVHKVSSLFIMKNLFLMFMTFLFAVLAFIDKDIIYPFDAKKMMMMELFVLGAPVFVIALESNKKRASGNLFESVLKNGIPSALSLIISVSAALAITAANGGEQQYIGSVAAITLTMSSFVCLFFTASPLARLSKITVALMIVASVVTIYLDKTILNGRFINVDLPSAADFLSIALCVAASVASNILLRKAFSRVAVKKTVGAVARN